MATESVPAPQRLQPQIGPGVFVKYIVPLFMFMTLLFALAVAAGYAFLFFLPSIRADKGTNLVWRRLEDPIVFQGKDYNPYLWFAILIPLLVLGLVYVIWMYVRDGVTIGWAWAAFLAALRGTIYGVIALVFLLPALQKWETAESQSKVLVVFDVSGSMLATRDDIPTAEVPLEKLLTRQDKVLRFLGDEKVSFFKRLHEKNPVTTYRFGRQLDEDYYVFDTKGAVWTSAAWEKHLHHLGEDREDARPMDNFNFDTLTKWLKPNPNEEIPQDLNDKDREELVKKLENLRRLTGATNVGTPLRKVFDRERNNLVQGIVVFTDGRNTEGSTSALTDLIEAARRADPHVPIFVVGVGEERERVRIEIADLRVPEQIRPEDRFRANVDVKGEGLAGREINVELDIFRVNRKTEKPEGEIALVEVNSSGQPIPGAEVLLGNKVTLKSPAKFQAGNPPQAQVEFTLDAATVAKLVGKEPAEGNRYEFKDDAEGALRFQARVPRDPREDFTDKEHKSDGADVVVVKRPLRILLMASGPMRDYQFLRTLLVREKERAELSVYLQPVMGQETPRDGRVQDVPPERLLNRFPDKMEALKDDRPLDPETDKALIAERNYNLANYDVVIAFDPDWNRLDAEQLKMVAQWVDKHAGGLIVVGGPVNTLELARPGAGKEKLKPIIDVYPVFLKDSRVQELNRKTEDPFRLHFPGATADMEFLKLDEEDPTAPMMKGWDNFFMAAPKSGTDKAPAPTGLRRGFYNFYPVKQKKDNATTVATFPDDQARLEDGSEQPYIVTAPFGSGRSVWIGSAETWRLRGYKEAYYERFWMKLARYAAGGNLSKYNKRISLNIGRNYTANNYVPIDATVLGTNLKPLPPKTRPRVEIKPPATVKDPEAAPKFELEPRAVPQGAEWDGVFQGRFMVKHPGQYILEIRVQETGDTETHKFTVKEANPELDNTRPDFLAMHSLATEAEKIMPRLPPDVQRDLKERLSKRKVAQAGKDKADPKKEVVQDERLRLYFDLSNADLIPSCMTVETKKQRNRGASNDLWDGGFPMPLMLLVLLAVMSALFAVVLLMTIIFAIMGKSVLGLLITLGVLILLIPATFIGMTVSLGQSPPIMMSTVLTIVAVLFSVEWLSRKLLRLA